ncbi:MAG: zinc-dependent peptidase [Chromatiales bacterium]|nr:zinc-dependent peptidase [Chromatiales bacterium]
MIRALSRWWHGRRPPGTLIDFETWNTVCTALPPVARYDAATRTRLHLLAEQFLREKAIDGAGGIEPDLRLGAWIAIQAAIPILNLGLDWYDGWYSVIVYPDDFRALHTYTDEAGVVHQTTRVLAGEAWHGGPVILSWAAVAREGSAEPGDDNVVIHEFAHKLDMRNGSANGFPPLHGDMDRERWSRVFAHAFTDLKDRMRYREMLPVDRYAAQSPAEFFAVASEAFFMDPRPLKAIWPAVYAELALFYRQDPARTP